MQTQDGYGLCMQIPVVRLMLMLRQENSITKSWPLLLDCVSQFILIYTFKFDFSVVFSDDVKYYTEIFYKILIHPFENSIEKKDW